LHVLAELPRSAGIYTGLSTVTNESTMSKRIRIGMLTPSSNTVLEPVTHAIVQQLAGVSVHFSRFTVKESSISPNALAQFDHAPMVRAAELLADARVDVIGWNGTSAAWLGFENDFLLCEKITQATGIPATTSMMAVNDILERTGVKTVGIASPYPLDMQERIVRNYAQLGIRCTSERHLSVRDNFAIATIPEDAISTMLREVAGARPDAILAICTNMNAAPLVAGLETELGIAIYDTVAAAVWSCLGIAGVDTGWVTGWGLMFWLRAGRSENESGASA